MHTFNVSLRTIDRDTRQRGYSLFELLVVVLLAAVVLSMSTPISIQSLRYTSTQSKKFNEQQELSRVEAGIRGICQNNRARSGIAPLHIGFQKVLDLQGAPIPLSRKIKKGQHSLSTILLDEILTLHRVNQTDFCAAQSHHTAKKHYLALYPSGLKLRHFPSSHTRCSLATDCPCRTHIPNVGTPSPLALFPVRDAFSLYLTNELTLRRASLLTRDNQPLSYDLTAFSLNERTEAAQRILAVRLEGRHGAVQEFECALGPKEYHALDEVF